MKILAVQSTPNPLARKVVCAEVVSAERASFRSAEDAHGHPLGQPLMAIPGVVQVMILADFVTVVRHPDARWAEVLPAVRRVIEAV